MSDKQHAQLVLRGYDITLNENNIGFTTTANNINFTFKNINLRTVLGNMYDKYDMFNLTVKYIGVSKLSAVFADNDNSNVILNISGLPFINQTYLHSRFCNTTNAVLGLFSFPTTAGQPSSQCFYSSNFLTFGKNQELVNINIFYTRVYDGAVPAAGVAYPEPVFVLDIFGIDKEDGNKNGMRL